jgi:hypothetical protein
MTQLRRTRRRGVPEDGSEGSFAVPRTIEVGRVKVGDTQSEGLLHQVMWGIVRSVAPATMGELRNSTAGQA